MKRVFQVCRGAGTKAGAEARLFVEPTARLKARPFKAFSLSMALAECTDIQNVVTGALKFRTKLAGGGVFGGRGGVLFVAGAVFFLGGAQIGVQGI